MKKVLLVAGTRPEAIKLAPVYLKLKEYTHFETILLSTGQHREMINQIFSFFEIRPDIELDLMVPGQTLPKLTSLLFQKLDETITQLEPSVILVQGDTTTAMVAAMLSYYHKIPVAHVEAGLRSNNRFSPFPEEVNRGIISLVADWHFAPTAHAAANLTDRAQGEVLVVGNTVIDSLLMGLTKINSNKKAYREKFAPVIPLDKKLILVTAHRRESFGESLDNICRAILQLAKKYGDIHFLFPVHLNPNVKTSVMSLLSGHPSISLISPVDYDDMIYLMSQSFMIMTDSGGIQEEAPSLNVPVIVMRDVTERTEGIEAGCAVLTGTLTEKIVSSFERILNDERVYHSMQLASNPYGDGNTAQAIAKVIAESPGVMTP